ncbi:unnamed protein product [Angiostrongylus costaricensis]|uniref:Pre-SET domain-containing protein n=1 Tax=Angiostrongylus costaricensis TaxID=334426 RepID=A0A0R3PK48_ANGCS|nr:unnamed protein product [Angiostrongylus costaricensis]
MCDRVFTFRVMYLPLYRILLGPLVGYLKVSLEHLGFDSLRLQCRASRRGPKKLIRLKDMVTQLLPGLKSRTKYGHEDIAYYNGSFHEFIYNPLRNNSNSRIRLCWDLSQGQELFPVEVYSDTENCDPPVNFFYISNNDFSNYRGQCSQDSESIVMVKCDCRSLVCSENCSCREMNDLLNPCTVMGDGRVFVNSDATFYNTLIVGCGEKCACMARCKNTLRSKCLPAPFNLNVLQSNDLDLRGSPSIDYAFCLQQADETEIYEKLKSVRLIQDESFEKWDRSVFVDPYRRGNVARFIAHGCFPNLTMLSSTALSIHSIFFNRYAENDLRLFRSRAILFANQPIAGGSENIMSNGNETTNGDHSTLQGRWYQQ